MTRRRRWTAQERKYLYERDKGVCGICGEKIDLAFAEKDPFFMHIDHIIPLNKGGLDDLSNLQITHFRCNLRKGAGLKRGIYWQAKAIMLHEAGGRWPRESATNTASGAPRLGASVAWFAGRGLVVGRVQPGSFAERAGLQPGDVIVQVDWGYVTRPEQLEMRLRRLGHLPRQMRVRRGGGVVDLAIQP